MYQLHGRCTPSSDYMSRLTPATIKPTADTVAVRGTLDALHPAYFENRNI